MHKAAKTLITIALLAARGTGGAGRPAFLDHSRFLEEKFRPPANPLKER